MAFTEYARVVERLDEVADRLEELSEEEGSQRAYDLAKELPKLVAELRTFQ